MSDDKKQKIINFLDKIKQLESSGGENTDHAEMTSGIHAGTSAIGDYGLMPNTIREVIGRKQKEGISTPVLDSVNRMQPDEMKAFIRTNPEQGQQIAEYLAGHVLQKQQNDDEKAAYSWLNGHNLTPEKINERNYKQNPYVQRFNNIKKLMGK